MVIKQDPDVIRAYLEDSSNIKGGHADEVVLPENIGELSEFIKYANQKRIPVTISGGGTGSAGSRVPFGGTVVSMERFNKILDISDKASSGLVETGVLVEDLKKACADRGLFYTSHPTEKTASVGGTVATNASGSRSFKYGPTRRYVKRLKMVLATGEILDLQRGEKMITAKDPRLRLAGGREIYIPIPKYRMPDVKNSAGYHAKDGMDLIDLFVGQEGTLSIIIEIGLEFVKLPSKILSSFVFFNRQPDAWSFAVEARRPEWDALSLEYFDGNALSLLRDANPNVPKGSSAAIFFEQEIGAEDEDGVLNKWLSLIGRYNIPLERTWVAMNEKDAQLFTKWRHHIPDSINDIVRKSSFPKVSTDIAVPPGSFLEMMNFYVEQLKKDKIRHVIFGHIGECHLHVNLLPSSEEEMRRAKETCLVFVKKGVSLGGTISAEHGVGKTKHLFLEVMYTRDGIIEMARIKKALDPNCILGLDNIFPREVLRWTQ